MQDSHNILPSRSKSSHSPPDQPDAMDLDEIEPPSQHFSEVLRSRMLSSPAPSHLDEFGSKTSSLRDVFGRQFTEYPLPLSPSERENILQRSADDPMFQQASRLFKSSMKSMSDRYGPFIPPEDGSPVVAMSLTRMWQQLSPQQRLEWWLREKNETVSENEQPSSTLQVPRAPASGFLVRRSAEHSPSEYSANEPSFFQHIAPMHQSGFHRPSSWHIEDDEGSRDSSGANRSRSQSPAEESSTRKQPPRPANAWILYRASMLKKKKPDGTLYTNAEVTVIWRDLSDEERAIWFERAKETKIQHQVANPGYRYQPRRRKQVQRGTTASATAGPSTTSGASSPSASMQRGNTPRGSTYKD